eukprot:TRINITY_DN21468_c0_g1_i1.p1 TRINITY_DN21468_c0_g1~~TRINITY_DN21468_c0_g1_i1.p1  ORF type:complete len:204 (+),score=56.37 TRINITY_DN21468_c0_g1_i1:47-613(+)
MVLWEAIVIVRPTIGAEQLQQVLKTYCTYVMREGGVVRKVRNEGVMRLHKGMHAGPTDKRRMYVPYKHEWRIHEPVDEKLLFHGRYIVMLFDSSVQSCIQLQKTINAQSHTLEWQIRQREKHHPFAAFKDPHDFEIGSDLQSLSEETAELLHSHPQWGQWRSFQARRWSDYLTQAPNSTDLTPQASSA